MPSWILAVASVSSIKWALLGIEGALWRGFTLAEMALPCLVLLGFGAICFAVGVRGLRET
jgi:ABC-2 type transport system permease protein